jgi:hypothetical protein
MGDTKSRQMMMSALMWRHFSMMVHWLMGGSFMRPLAGGLWSKEIKKRIVVAATISPCIIGG